MLSECGADQGSGLSVWSACSAISPLPGSVMFAEMFESNAGHPIVALTRRSALGARPDRRRSDPGWEIVGPVGFRDLTCKLFRTAGPALHLRNMVQGPANFLDLDLRERAFEDSDAVFGEVPLGVTDVACGGG